MIDTFNDWIEFTGNEMPVRNQTLLLQVKFKGQDGYASDPHPACRWYWRDDARAPISHYRIASIAPEQPLFRGEKNLNATEVKYRLDEIPITATECEARLKQFCKESKLMQPFDPIMKDIVSEIEKILRNGGSSYAALCAIEEYKRLES